MAAKRRKTNPRLAELMLVALWQALDHAETLLAEYPAWCRGQIRRDITARVCFGQILVDVLGDEMSCFPEQCQRVIDQAHREGDEERASWWQAMAEMHCPQAEGLAPAVAVS